MHKSLKTMKMQAAGQLVPVRLYVHQYQIRDSAGSRHMAGFGHKSCSALHDSP
jgi:hypothetical protein